MKFIFNAMFSHMHSYKKPQNDSENFRESSVNREPKGKKRADNEKGFLVGMLNNRSQAINTSRKMLIELMYSVQPP